MAVKIDIKSITTIGSVIQFHRKQAGLSRIALYDASYDGPPVSLTAPVRHEPYEYDSFPPFLEGLLPEGYNLEALVRALKIDHHDHLSQLLAVGTDMVGAITVREAQ